MANIKVPDIGFLDRLATNVVAGVQKSDDQPRDEKGRFGSGGADKASEHATNASRAAADKSGSHETAYHAHMAAAKEQEAAGNKAAAGAHLAAAQAHGTVIGWQQSSKPPAGFRVGGGPLGGYGYDASRVPSKK